MVYNIPMKNKILIVLLLASGLLFHVSCIWLTKENPNLKIPIRLERKDLHRASLLIFNFREPSYAEGMGAYTARLMHTAMLKKRAFKVAALDTASPWARIADEEETRLLDALEEGKTHHVDYILVGDILDCQYGAMTPTRVSLRFRIIEVATRATIFMAENGKVSTSTDPTFPMNTHLSEKALPPNRLMEALIAETLNKL